MLTIGKIGGRGKGHWASPSYYSQQVVRGAEDYYAGKGEAPGSWAGSGAGALELEGVIGDGELEAIFERCHPATGEQLRSGGPAREQRCWMRLWRTSAPVDGKS